MSTLDDLLTRCTCCAGRRTGGPVELAQRPGLARLAYRAGTHGSFKRSMLAALATAGPLARLGTRSDDDPTVALIDAWAAVLDVLTFYQERIANEAYLRTALEERSLLELARLIGYQPRPGVAAGVAFAFTLDPAAPETVILPSGTRAQSVPAGGGLPQSFETSKELLARPGWNTLTPRRSQPQSLDTGTGQVWLAGTATGLEPGDPLLLEVGGANPILFEVTAVEPDAEGGRTRASIQPAPVASVPSSPLAVTHLHALRVRTAAFGHNAPAYRTVPAEWRTGTSPVFANWDPSGGWPITRDAYLNSVLAALRLAQFFPEIRPGSWVVLRSPTSVEAHRVDDAAEIAVADFGLSGRATRVTFQGFLVEPEYQIDDYRDLGTRFTLRETAIYAASEELALAEEPIEAPVAGSELELEEAITGLTPGRRLILRGEPVATPGVVEHEELVLAAVVPGEHPRLAFTRPLGNTYRRDTVTVCANVVAATHGETREEVLGSGDASLPFQRFRLRQGPLTYTSAPVASGGESSLELRVGGVLWQEAPGFYGLGPDERAYVLRRSGEGVTEVLFGDGRRGARLPTGTENITARYRVGIGRDGLAGAGQIALLATRPLGVRGVTNPLDASGAEDPEGATQARANAPLTVLTLERAVSLRDFEDFARAFSGIGKAQARWVWNGSQRVVHLTVAGTDGAPASETVTSNLIQALAAASTPYRPLQVDSYRPVFFGLTASLRLEPAHRSEDVFAAVETALSETFSFTARDFAQRVATSEVLAVIQAVTGVAAVTLDSLAYDGPSGDREPDALGLSASPAEYDADSFVVRAAQLLAIRPESIHLAETAS